MSTPTGGSAKALKERMMNTIKRDRQNIMTDTIQEPLQPYMTFMMDVADLYIRSNRTDNNAVSIANTVTGLKFCIRKMKNEDINHSLYKIELSNNNEIRFSAQILNASMAAPNQWYFTQKYEDLISKEDVYQFIHATAMLYSMLMTDKFEDEEQLVATVLATIKVGARSRQVDNNIKMTYSWKDEDTKVHVKTWMHDILLSECDAERMPNGTYAIYNMDVQHHMPTDVLTALADQLRPTASKLILDSTEAQIREHQEQYYNSTAGRHQQETAQLNDIFAGYHSA